jgi:ankyrin repeat protein
MKIGTPFIVRAARDGDLQGVKRQCEMGVDINEKFDDKKTVASEAWFYNHLNVVNYLLGREGFNPNVLVEDRGSWKPLIAAAAGRGYLEMVQKLYAIGTDIYATFEGNKNALHEAKYYAQTEVESFILSNQFDDVTNYSLEDFTKFINPEDFDVKREVYDNGRVKPVIVAVARRGFLDLVKELCERSADINAESREGKTAVSEAWFYGHYKVVNYLLDREGFDPNILVEDKGCWKPLITAAAGKGYLEVVKLLLEKGADINA